MLRLIEVAPNLWRVDKPSAPVARSSLPCPMVISDEMPPCEQVDGRYYTSKSEFRKIGRSLGLVEIGNEKVGPKRRSTDDRRTKAARQQALRIAAEKYKSR